MEAVGKRRTAWLRLFLCGLLSFEDFLSPWVPLGHFVACCCVGGGRSSFSRVALDLSRFWDEALIPIVRSEAEQTAVGVDKSQLHSPSVLFLVVQTRGSKRLALESSHPIQLCPLAISSSNNWFL